MALNYSDLTTRGWQRYHGTSSGNAVITLGNGIRIMAISLMAGTTNSSVLVYNAATATGSDLIGVTALANSANGVVYLGPNGTKFDVGVSTTLAGTGATVDIFYLAE